MCIVLGNLMVALIFNLLFNTIGTNDTNNNFKKLRTNIIFLVNSIKMLRLDLNQLFTQYFEVLVY